MRDNGRLTANERARWWPKPLAEESRDLAVCVAGDALPEDGFDEGKSYRSRHLTFQS